MNETILVIEDDLDLARALAIRLKASGYRVLRAQDAVLALTVARKEQPDLVLLDLGLPGGDGFTVLRRLADLVATPVPVIVLTAREPLGNEDRALAAGAEAFFQKPVEARLLLAAIRTALSGGDDRQPSVDPPSALSQRRLRLIPTAAEGERMIGG